MKTKTLLAAGIVKDLQFRCRDDYDLFVYHLQHRCVSFKVLETYERPDGVFFVRILQQYNNSPLIQLYE